MFSAETGQVESKVFARAVDRVNTDNREFPEVQMQAIPIMLKEGQTWENYQERKNLTILQGGLFHLCP